MKFEELNIKKDIIKGLLDHDISEPTLIQEKAIPKIIQGKDVIGMSKTGSGKTAAFGIPILHNIDRNKGLQAIIMAPTRELAVQISNEMAKFGKYLNLNIATVFGGVAIGPQINAIAKAHIVVGTPGRLLDHLERGTMNLSTIRSFVLDEADKMVEMGFIEDITRILEPCPKDRQILLFGATLSREIRGIQERYMNNPEVAEAESHVKDDFLEQYYYNIQPQEKFSLLVHLMKQENSKRVIVFCSTRNTVEIVSKNLKAQDIHCDMIHGKLSQNRRLKVIDIFNQKKQAVLVASAVAARGLDIRNVTHVFNYDLSRDPQEYIHRVGRTARAGESGKAFTLLSGKDHDIFSAILGRYPIKVDKLEVPEFEKLRFHARDHNNNRNFNRIPGRSFGGPRRSSFGEQRTPSRPGGRRWGDRN